MKLCKNVILQNNTIFNSWHYNLDDKPRNIFYITINEYKRVLMTARHVNWVYEVRNSAF